MRIFKNAWFQRFARKERLTDEVLVEAVRQAEKGLIDADLGRGVIKQRVARRGRGKSGGYRTIILFRRGERAFFMYGFAKSQRDNMEADELADFKELATLYLVLSDEQIEALIENDVLIEVPT